MMCLVISDLVVAGGHRLHLETYGDPSAPAVLYVHGGPGQGCFHFAHSQAGLLGDDVHLVLVDQRGAMRSSPLAPGEQIATSDVVDDFEEVRQRLDLERWTVIGHSAGAATALEYAVTQPGSVAGLVLDCPALDADLIDRWRLPIAADLLDEMGLHEPARRARDLAAQPERLTPATYEVLDQLGERRNELFFLRPEQAREFDHVTETSGYSEEIWERGSSHAPLLAGLYRSRLALLDDIRCPILLVRGLDDPVSPPAVVAAIRASAHLARAVELERSRHFPSFEQPEAYAAAILDFVQGSGEG